MRIGTDELQALRSRLVAPIGHSTHVEESPKLVPSLVAGLIDPGAIRAAVTTYDGGPPTVWTVYAATGQALAYVEVEFDKRQYTAEVEDDAHKYRGPYATAAVKSAWVRALSRIAEMTISRSDVFADTGRWNVSASVRFLGVDEPVTLPDQHSIYSEEQWERSDDLLHAIRDGISAPR
jgi:hypothetical protein